MDFSCYMSTFVKIDIDLCDCTDPCILKFRGDQLAALTPTFLISGAIPSTTLELISMVGEPTEWAPLNWNDNDLHDQTLAVLASTDRLLKLRNNQRRDWRDVMAVHPIHVRTYEEQAHLLLLNVQRIPHQRINRDNNVADSQELHPAIGLCIAVPFRRRVPQRPPISRSVTRAKPPLSVSKSRGEGRNR